MSGFHAHLVGPTRGPAPLRRVTRRRDVELQLIEVTIDSLAEMGYVGSTLAQIAGRADVSPGLVAHYFGDRTACSRSGVPHADLATGRRL